MLTLRANLKILPKAKSFIAKEHPEILEDFADIIGGEYAHHTKRPTLLYS